MREFVGFTITGLVTASIYAIVATGLTLTYATTGIFNWAHGAFAAIGAFVYWQLTTQWGWPAVLAIVVCVGLIGPVLGIVVEAGIMRRLEGTSEITRMAVTLALLVGIVAGINWIWDPQSVKVVIPLLDGHAVYVLGQRLPAYDLLVMAMAVVVGVSLRWLLYRRRAGVQMRGTVDDRTLIILNGVSPIRTAQLSWTVGASTAVLAGVLIAPKTSLAAGSLALLIMNAFAAAVVGRLRSLPLTIVGAVILGLSTAYAQGYVGSRPNFPGGRYLIGMVNIVPVIVLFAALQFLPQERLRSAKALQAREISTKPSWRGTSILAVCVVGATIALAPLLAVGDLHNMTKIWGIGLIALSLVPLLGWAGRLSVCPFAFGAIGAIIAAHMTPDGQMWGLLFAALGAALVGALLSLPGARLSPLYLALATAAFAIALENWIFRLPAFDIVIRIPFSDVTLYRTEMEVFQGGSLTVRRPELFGIDLTGDHAFLVFTSVVFALALFVLTALRRSDLGLRMLALKDSPLGYATVGLNRRITTVAAFAISAGIAGVGGALLGAAIQRPGPDQFGFFNGLGVLIIVVVLGVSTLGSPIGVGVFLAAPVLANLFPSIAQATPTLTAAAGVGLGNNPNGSIPSDLRPTWTEVARDPRVLWPGLGIIAASYAATVTGVLSNWGFAWVCILFLVVVPVVAQARARRRARGAVAAGRKIDGTTGGVAETIRTGGVAATTPGPSVASPRSETVPATIVPERLAQSLPLSSEDLDHVDRILGVRSPIGASDGP